MGRSVYPTPSYRSGSWRGRGRRWSFRKRSFEEPAFIGDAVDIRCRCNFPEALTVGGNRFGGVVIGKDENNVRVSCRLSDSNGREDGNEDSQEIFYELLKPSPNALAGQEKNLRYGYVS